MQFLEMIVFGLRSRRRHNFVVTAPVSCILVYCLSLLLCNVDLCGFVDNSLLLSPLRSVTLRLQEHDSRDDHLQLEIRTTEIANMLVSGKRSYEMQRAV
jgi:hypothetical protein